MTPLQRPLGRHPYQHLAGLNLNIAQTVCYSSCSGRAGSHRRPAIREQSHVAQDLEGWPRHLQALRRYRMRRPAALDFPGLNSENAQMWVSSGVSRWADDLGISDWLAKVRHLSQSILRYVTKYITHEMDRPQQNSLFPRAWVASEPTTWPI